MFKSVYRCIVTGVRGDPLVLQGAAVAKSISALAKGGASAKLTEYRAGGGMPDAMVVSSLKEIYIDKLCSL